MKKQSEPRTHIRGFFLLIAVAGCSATVTPPRSPARPTAVYLCDYGYHSSLLLPVSDGVYVEYLYGDFEWAALDHSGPLDVVRAGLFSSSATLGRRYVYEPGLEPAPFTRPVTQARLTVDGDACQRLQTALDARWMRQSSSTVVYNDAAGMFYLYVRDDQHYGLLHECNGETADWLSQLGCRIGGVPMLSHFAVDGP